MSDDIVSIIIPIRNEEKYIAKCLDSVLDQTYPKDKIEILVIDGMSDDNTRNIVRTYANQNNNIKVFDNEKRIAPSAMNIGLKQAKGSIIIRLDGHSFADKNYVEECVDKLKTTDADCVGGPLRNVGENMISEAISLATSSPFGVGNSLSRYCKKEVYVDTVFFGAYRREVFKKVGVFDEELVRSQDCDLNYRITKAGGKILLTPTIKTYYHCRSSLNKLWRQYFQYGFWKVRVIKKHKRPTSIRQLVPSVFVVTLGISLLGCLFSRFFTWLLVSIVISYLTLNIFFSIRALGKKTHKSIFYLPIIFPILHLSYGLGFINGVITFLIFKRESTIKKHSQISR